MFKVITAPVAVIVAFCKVMMSIARSAENITTSIEKATEVALDHTTTWADGEREVNQANADHLRKRIEAAKTNNQRVTREALTDNEVQF